MDYMADRLVVVEVEAGSSWAVVDNTLVGNMQVIVGIVDSCNRRDYGCCLMNQRRYLMMAGLSIDSNMAGCCCSLG